MTALLNSNSVGLLCEWFSNLGEVAVGVILIFDLAGVVDECKVTQFIIKNSLESLFSSVHHPCVPDHFVQVGVLFSDRIVPHTIPANILQV